ncbi:hypothetical protein GYH30_006315 [Glycine max]|nr:hypothetical protein GYH30_006315 [Glycine max]
MSSAVVPELLPAAKTPYTEEQPTHLCRMFDHDGNRSSLASLRSGTRHLLALF